MRRSLAVRGLPCRLPCRLQRHPAPAPRKAGTASGSTVVVVGGTGSASIDTAPPKTARQSGALASSG